MTGKPIALNASETEQDGAEACRGFSLLARLASSAELRWSALCVFDFDEEDSAFVRLCGVEEEACVWLERYDERYDVLDALLLAAVLDWVDAGRVASGGASERASAGDCGAAAGALPLRSPA